MKTTAYYIKTAVLVIVIFLASFFLTETISEPIRNQDYFSFSPDYAIRIVLLMLINLYAFSLTVGAWNKWEQYLIVPLPVSSAIFFSVASINPVYAFIIAVLAGILLAFDVNKSTRISNLLVKFDPKIILRLSTSGMLFVFSIVGGVLVILYSLITPEFNIGKEVSSLVEKPLKSIVETQLRNNLENQLIPLNLSGNQDLDPGLEGLLQQFGLELDFKDVGNMVNEEEVANNLVRNLDVKGIVEKEVNNYVGPYKDFVHPILAVLMFALFQFYAAISLFIYLITIDGIFWLARKSNFFKSEFVEVQKENLKF